MHPRVIYKGAMLKSLRSFYCEKDEFFIIEFGKTRPLVFLKNCDNGNINYPAGGFKPIIALLKGKFPPLIAG